MTKLKTSPLGRPVNYLIAVGVALVIGGIEMFGIAAHKNRAVTEAAQAGAIPVTVTATACEPMALTVPAGKASFRITNASDRPVEWEILDGVMVLAERENIAPGFSSVLSERLKPGTYAVTCGLLSNPRGSLTVLATAESEADRAAPPLRDFLGPLSERKVHLMRAAATLVQATRAMERAIAGGNSASAREAWAEASAAWAALGLVAPRFSDLQNRIAPRAEFLALREADPAFVGLSRIEHALFKADSLEGLAPVAAALVADAAEFAARVKAHEATPEAIAGDAARLARALSEGQAAGGLAPYATDDRAQLGVALAAMRKSFAIEAPLLAAAKPEAVAPVEAALAAVETALTASAPDRAPRAKALARLDAALSAVNPALGLE